MRIVSSMHTVFAFMLASLGVATAQANVISVQGSGLILPNTSGQQITLLMSGSDFYSDSNLRMTINGGVGPAAVITHVFGDNLTAIPVGNLAGSIWQNGFGGIAGAPDGTSLDSSGLTTAASFGTAGFASINTQGVYAVLTISTVGFLPGGPWMLDFTGTDLFNGLDEAGEPIPVPLEFAPIQIGWLPGIGVLAATPSPGSPIIIDPALLPSTAAQLTDAISLTNTGESILFVETAAITGPDAGLFSLLGFSQTTLSPEEILQYGLAFSGAVAPGTYTASLQFTFDGGALPISYPLSVTVVPEPSTCALAVIGIVATLVTRRRR